MSSRHWYASILTVCLLVLGIGAAISHWRGPSATTGTLALPGSQDEALARLRSYTRSVGADKPAPKPEAAEPLADVNTMIERLAARLETAPGDIKGWRMLGWSYFHTARYQEAAVAYARAVGLDPNSAELKRSYEEAKAKAAEAASSSQTETAGKGDGPPGVEKKAKSEPMPPRAHDAIRSMVDGLANRLENSPRDVEGWTRLMRSRVVLGERQVATAAFRRALEVFKDDTAATGEIAATAIELGLKAE
jgi:cytochrome c-type biogenesis protein CcmH/NrfG